ncbi:MAG: DUF1349 domain-containing protein [Propionivibrio sp.]
MVDLNGDRGPVPAFAWQGGQWLNPPPDFAVDGARLHVVTDAASDFWQETFYGFKRDSGHFYGFRTDGDFTAQLRVQGQFQALYDQAGIMVRIDETHWMKAGIELSDGRAMLSSVVTAGRSDWATNPYEGNPEDFRIRATVKDGVLRLQVSHDGGSWALMRLCPFPVADRYTVGPMTCSPERGGLKVSFSDWRLGPPLDRQLHDLS